MSYKAVIVPDMETIRSTTVEILKKFHDDGGCVIFAGNCPEYVDATCPFVLRINDIVSKESAKGSYAVLLGDADHPEVRGIVSCATAGCSVFSTAKEAAEFVKATFDDENAFFAAVQTTFSKTEWKLFENILKKLYTNPKIFDTICNVTSVRQEEADRLTKDCDAVIVVGGLKSSNTKKLFDIARANCKNAVMTEDAAAENILHLVGGDGIGKRLDGCLVDDTLKGHHLDESILYQILSLLAAAQAGSSEIDEFVLMNGVESGNDLRLVICCLFHNRLIVVLISAAKVAQTF